MELEYTPISQRPRTILIDLDGVILKQTDRWPDMELDPIKDLLPGVRKKMAEWNLAGHKIIILTARPQAYRRLTERQLQCAGVLYDMLVMGLPSGQRILINDRKPQQKDIEMAIAINLDRDQGIEGVKI